MDSRTVRINALSGKPLADHAVLSSVVAAAHALAERSGIRIVYLSTGDDFIEVDLVAEEVVAVGFAAELRRITNKWFEEKFRAGPMWGTRRAESNPEEET